jgi:hypothetical protein
MSEHNPDDLIARNVADKIKAMKAEVELAHFVGRCGRI